MMKEQDFVAGQDFLLAVKKHWTTQMYPAVKQLHADIGDGADETLTWQNVSSPKLIIACLPGLNAICRK